MVKLVVSDIDGTLVGDGQGAEFLSPEYFQEIERLYDKGIRFMVCSGRQRQSVKKMFAPVADKIFLGCDGGSLVFDHEKLLFSKTIQKEKAWEKENQKVKEESHLSFSENLRRADDFFNDIFLQ